jgi:hypothetical protein
MTNSTEWELIHAYTRKQAIEDGVLVDVSEVAKKVGFLVGVAFTSAVWSRCVDVSPAVEGMTDYDRVSDILWMCRNCVTFDCVGGEPGLFIVAVRVKHEESEQPLETLKAVLSYDDQGSPCITIMMPEED